MLTLIYTRIFVILVSSLLDSTTSITLNQKRFLHSSVKVNSLTTSCSRMSTSSSFLAKNSATDTSDNSSNNSNNKKIIAIIRHGKTECNEYLHTHEWGCQNFKDPELWDTVLSAAGRKQAGLLNYKVINSNDPSFTDLLKAELIVSSPLTRALHTTELALENTPFDTWSNCNNNNNNKNSNNTNDSNQATSTSSSSSTYNVPKIVLPLAAERVYLSSDVGRTKPMLQTEFPAWDFSLLHPTKLPKLLPSTTTSITTSSHSSSVAVALEEKGVNNISNNQSQEEAVVDVPWWYRNSNFKEASRTRARIPNSKYIDNVVSSSSNSRSSGSGGVSDDGSNHGDHSPSKRSKSVPSTSTSFSSSSMSSSTSTVSRAATTVSSSTSTSVMMEDENTVHGPLCLNSYLDTSEYIEWRPKGYYAAAGEPFQHFRARMIELRKWLINRPENFIILTCHWGVARALTGTTMMNCEVKYIDVEDILLEPYIDNNE